MEVLIIGAGVAGLAAAEALSAAGVSVCILEARDRIGGRIRTVRDAKLGAPIELGAEFIHGRPPDIFAIVKAAGLAADEVKGGHRTVRRGKLVERRSIWPEIDALFRRMAQPGEPDQAFAQFLRAAPASKEAKSWARRYVEGFDAARADLISTWSLAQDAEAADAIEGDRAFRIKEGYDQLAQWFWQRCHERSAMLRLNCVVARIEWRRGKVMVTTRGPVKTPAERYAADRAIVTVPLGVLKTAGSAPSAIRFEPEPPSLRAALERLEMGHAVRISLRFSEQFRRANPDVFRGGFIHSDDEWLPTWWTSLSPRLPMLTAWAGGPKAEQFAGLSDEETRERALSSLSNVLGKDHETLAKCLEGSYTHDWSSDPFSRGAYSYALVGGIEARQTLAAPLEDTIYFAGEAAETEGHSGTVHGALLTGKRAAQAILRR